MFDKLKNAVADNAIRFFHLDASPSALASASATGTVGATAD